MMQALEQRTLEMEHFLDVSSQFYQDLLGYSPEQTSLQQVSEACWSEFTQVRGLNPDSTGVYLPRNQTAVIMGNRPLSLFHEYFGHGLYCEQSLAGRKLVWLERKLLEEEMQKFDGKEFTLQDLQRFRQSNQTFQELERFRKENLGKYELFAVWTEYLLSREFGFDGEFEGKYGLVLPYGETFRLVVENLCSKRMSSAEGVKPLQTKRGIKNATT